MKKIYFITALLLIPAIVSAQKIPDDNKQNKTSWFQNTIKAIGQTIDEWTIEGIDTNYVALPHYGWQAAVTANFAGINMGVLGHNIPTYGSIDIDMNSKLSGQTSISLGYRIFSWDYSFDIANGYSSDFNLSWLDNSWGIEYRSHTTKGLSGTLDASATAGNLPVKENDTRLRATIINGYYVFNSERYSLPAAMEQSLVQRKSAGSLTAYILYLSATLEANNSNLVTMLGGMKKVEFYQTAIGLGYGYNYTPNEGRLLIHASAAPLLVFFNKNFITADYAFPLTDGSYYHVDMLKEVKTKHNYFLTGVARASIFYHITPRIYFGCAALINNIRFDSDSGVEIKMNDWIANATIGIRF
ncbi:MAG: DUF4421 family protein [Bacteroidales bacterium]|nr:DUF4421 family protein [Bacteroidales bacterium]